MFCVSFILWAVLLVNETSTREFTDEEYSLLPRLYEIDDYEECLKRAGGVYCLGSFHLEPKTEPDSTYNLIKEYSQQINAYNRTLIHRGYCVSERCPITSLNTSDVALLFADCVASYTYTQGLRATPINIEYCHTHEDHNASLSLDTPKIAFIVLFCFVMLFNIIGTAYDLIKGDHPKKNKYIMAWSLKKNLNDFVAQPYDDRISLTALQGIRVIVATCACLVHTGFVFYKLFIYNPRYLEEVSLLPVTMLVQNGTSMVQMFVVLSSFFCAYNVKKMSGTPAYLVFFKLLLKRIVRLYPVYFGVILFAASWWPELRSGPLWPVLVGAESDICREKFWTHAVFVNNLIQPSRICLIPTWYIAVDIQLYILALMMTLLLSRLRSGVLAILTLLLVSSVALNAVLAYHFNWSPMVYFASVTEDIREYFVNVPSFSNLYMSPWGNLPACIIGLLLGHLFQMKRDTWIKVAKYKWVLYTVCAVSIPIIIGWILLGYYVKLIKSQIFMALLAATERSLFQVFYLIVYVIMAVLSSAILKGFSWRVWRPLSRMSLSVMLTHWCVILFVLGPNPLLIYVDFFAMAVAAIAVVCMTYIVAFPITLALEMPMKTFFDHVIS